MSRPKQIGTRVEIIDGKEVLVRVYEPAGVTEGIRKPLGHSEDVAHLGIAHKKAFEIRQQRKLGRLLNESRKRT